MTAQQIHLLHLLKAAEAAYQAIDKATDIPGLQVGDPLEGWQVERIHNGLCRVSVELDEAIDAARALICLCDLPSIRSARGSPREARTRRFPPGSCARTRTGIKAVTGAGCAPKTGR